MTSSHDGGRYNTHKLGYRILSDITSALSAGILVAPLISIIDRSIIENASGKRKIIPSIKSSFKTLFFRPHVYLTSRPFLLVFGLYSSTYFTANSIDTITSTIRNKSPDHTTSGPAKFLATSTTNMSLSLYKDSQFTKMFGGGNGGGGGGGGGVVSKRIPLPTLLLYGMRDSLTIFASFNLPPLIADKLPVPPSVVESHMSRKSMAQFLAPAGIQFLSTPLHLLGLDLYNRPKGKKEVGFGDRMRKVKMDWLKSTIARMARIIPAFGFGGVVNSGVRQKLLNRV